MTLKNIFQKPVDRNIEGVIKADDDASLRLELDEYVITNEVEKRLDAFLDAYNNYQDANGVWVSGFFGSGKSHLLKMLALVLENRKVESENAAELFLSKPAFKDNEILRGDLNKAVAIPSKSILLNIDQKADVISKTQLDALLSVFVKVFNEECGYYGKQPYVAEFERDLDSDGLLDAFKARFREIASKEWEWARQRSKRMTAQIDEAYNAVAGQSVSQILDKYRSDYRLSIEDFAEQILAYIDRQGADFRLNFFVDEVGQYIADNVKLMTNLQTIAESLATKCRGRSWIIVTAQEDMNSVVGEMGKQESNDFTKIQARFKNRMKLTSQDVAEVIQKRLLLKNDRGVNELSDLYHNQENNFKTLFDFADGSQTYRNFQDRDHFIHSYPFIPYQFALFQSAIQNLSLHSAFEGKHSSVGERSMLGVFQQVAMHIADHQIGQLATFDLMFEGIRTVLKSQIQRAVIQAENHLDNPFAVRVLKALFLVKYVKEFKATVRNLCVLMLDDFNQDLPALRNKVEEALNLLEQQTYIQRNGEQYEYLTDEEKDVEEEIKNTEVESSEVAVELEKIVFDHIIKNKKIRFDGNDQDYPYGRKLDDRLHGREHELAIHVITPFHENAESLDVLRGQSMARPELMVIMQPDDRLMRDITLYKQTEKYIRQNISMTQQEGVKRILESKGFQNRERYSGIQQRVKSLLGQAGMLVSGGDVEIGSSDAQSRIIQGFHELIRRTYPNLSMLRGIAYTENDVSKYLQYSQEGLLGNDVTSLAESEQELLAFIQSNSRGGVRTTLKTLIEKFECKPYGWYYAAILCTLAMLCARGKVEARRDSNLLEEDDLQHGLLNSRGHANVVLEPQIDFTASQVRNLKEFYEDFFDAPPQAGESKALGKDTGTAIEELINQLNLLVAQADQYPFLNSLVPVVEQLAAISGKPYTWYLTELPGQEDELLDLKDQLIDPLRKFMGGPQKAIYRQAKRFLQDQEANFTHIKGEEVRQIRSVLNDPQCFKGNRIQQLKTELGELQGKVDQKVQEVRVQTIESLRTMQSRMQSMDEYKKLPEERTEELDAPYKELVDHINQQPLIAVINDRMRYFEEQGYQTLLAKMVEMANPKPAKTDTTAGDDSEPRVAEPEIEYISTRKLKVSFNKAWLANEADVDEYLQQLRKALLREIEAGKRIQV
ncbi:MAG: BREX system P-loop protein BrxC [gamma proteobacterium symbiont of Bathyaustriella thionipta]|nr:BREX system P-loop protein BrxC [gamma proteobacterium symbiont of Bathyaustriella thionipta]